MAGTVTVIGVIAGVAVLTGGYATVGAAHLCAQKTASAADAAALAAANTASGAAFGHPCERAAELAEANGARLVSCDLTGLTATVTVSTSFMHFSLSSRARAGPPPTK